MSGFEVGRKNSTHRSPPPDDHSGPKVASHGGQVAKPQSTTPVPDEGVITPHSDDGWDFGSGSPSPISPVTPGPPAPWAATAESRLPPKHSNTLPSLPTLPAELQERVRGPLIPESPVTTALHAYDDVRIPPNTTFVLATSVFDGSGDLEHLLRAVTHLAEQRKSEPFARLVVWIERREDVPQQAWDDGIAEIRKLGVEVYLTGKEIPTAESAKSAQFSSAMASMKPCVINISTEARQIESSRILGYIPEYGGRGDQPSGLKSLTTGFAENSIGVWQRSDPAFQTVPPAPSAQLQTTLFGSVASTDTDLPRWEVGAASLRTDGARLAYIKMRVQQCNVGTGVGKSCVIAVSAFADKSAEALREIAKSNGFDRCEIVGKDGSVTTILDDSREVSGKKEAPRILRIVNKFIEHDDYLALLGLARAGSLGGAGDTATVRGLTCDYPVFVEGRITTQKRVLEAAAFFKSHGFPQLAAWFRACAFENYEKIELLTQDTALKHEWNEFRTRAKDDFDIGHHAVRYFRRCAVMANPKDADVVGPIERKFLAGEMDVHAYQQKMREALHA